MNAVHARRLLKLADFLETVPPERLNMSSWVGRDWQGDQGLSCGTTACALGWAATMPEFRRLGLRLRAAPADDGGYGGHTSERWYYVGLERDRASVESRPKRAAMKIFGLDEDAFWRLFGCPEDYFEATTPKGVARSIRRHVKSRCSPRATNVASKKEGK